MGGVDWSFAFRGAHRMTGDAAARSEREFKFSAVFVGVCAHSGRRTMRTQHRRKPLSSADGGAAPDGE